MMPNWNIFHATKLFRIAVPIFCNNLVLLLVLVSETFFLSKVSDDAVVGVNSALPLIYGCVALIGTFVTVAMGRLGRAIGEGDEEKVKRAFSAGLFACLACGLLLTFVQIALAPHLGRWLGLAPEAARANELYIYGISLMCLLDGFFLTFTSFLYARGAAKKSLFSSLTLLICSLCINILLMLEVLPGCKLGPLTIALGTLISQLPPIAILATQLHWSGGFHIRKDLRIDSETFAYIKATFKDGVPACAEPLSVNLLQLVTISLIAPFGTAPLAALSYCRNLMLLLVVATSDAVGVATQVLVSHAQGRMDFDDASKVMWRSIKLFVPALFLVLVCIAGASHFSGGIVRFFSRDQFVWLAAQGILGIFIFSETARALSQVLNPSLRGSSDVLMPVMFAIGSHWIIGFWLACLFSQYWGFVGILCGLACAECARALFNTCRWQAGVWRTNLLRRQEAT